MKKIFLVKILLLLSFILFVASRSQKDKLPDKTDICRELYAEPVQSETKTAPFEIEKKGIIYTITPLYNYELSGLVVSFFHTATWWNSDHVNWKDYINPKDICVIWGKNIESEVYKKMHFSSVGFECSYYTSSSEAWTKFCSNCLSNNHLLSANENINKIIMRVGVGDQISLKGYLVKYFHSGNTFQRGTSITRTDTGPWSCETIYVTDFKIIKKANTVWRLLYPISKYLAVLCFIFYLIFFFTTPASSIISTK